MTLSELASYVCTKAQQVETDDVAAAKLFLSKRYELIYNSYLWKDALTMVDLTVDPTTNLDNANGIVQLPTQIDRVVAMRNCTNAILIHGLEEYFRNDWNRFADTTNLNGMVEFSILNPVYLTARPAAQPLPRTLIPVTGTYISQFYPSFGQQFIIQMFGLAYGWYALTCGVNELGLNIGVTENPSYYLSTGGALTIFGRAAGDAFTGQLYRIDGPPAGQTSGAGAYGTITSDNVGDLKGGSAPATIKVTWRDATNRYTVTGTMPMLLTPQDNSGFIEIESIFKPVTLGNITTTITNPVSVGAAVETFQDLIGTLLPTDTKAPQYQRVRLFGRPTVLTTLSVLGKKPFIPLDFDQEQPLIRNLDNCLIAFALGDMLTRARQFGKAATQLQEAALLLTELAKLETMQAANHCQFSPEGGYGDPFFGPSSDRGIWF